MLDLLGYVPGDDVVDLFPGTGIMGRVVQSRSLAPIDGELNLFGDDITDLNQQGGQEPAVTRTPRESANS